MSRQAAALPALLLAFASPVSAQDTVTAEKALQSAAEAYGPPASQPKRCPTVSAGEEIVVCAEEQEQSQFRLRSDEQAENDYARETMDKGAPRAPDVAGPGIFRGPATVSGMCGIGLSKCPPPPAYMIDFSQLPEAPPGSDADRVGQGLAPRGKDGAEAPVSPPESASPEARP